LRNDGELERYANNLWLVPWRRFGFNYSGIYLIAPKRKTPVKVGMSSDAAARISELQVSNWEPIFVHRYWICENQKLAREVELRAHDILTGGENRLYGEWFNVDLQKASDVIEHVGLELNIELAKALPASEKFEVVFDYLDHAIPRGARHAVKKLRREGRGNRGQGGEPRKAWANTFSSITSKRA
jgi:hypothetical protein